LSQITETEELNLPETKSGARQRLVIATWVILGILFIDQFIKFQVKTTMMLNTQIRVAGDWFYIHFTENPGMAFGLEFGGDNGKLVLTIFRIIAVMGIGWYLVKQTRLGASRGFIISLAMIFAGASGNIIDSVFYGRLFSDSQYQVAEFLPAEGYAPWFYGRVVDMFYFPVIHAQYPDWVPGVGGDPFIFFRPIFNVADTFISIGVIAILTFQTRFFKHQNKDENETAEIDESTETGDRDEENIPAAG
jgi:signal peptidase II